ncbi:MAG: hypothetical protein LBF12_06780 [Christensenellaceae bacterium]|jgi:dipicolinate synthase subunit A|nr:hypothetical protein [Christensenellaceae bacterium]
MIFLDDAIFIIEVKDKREEYLIDSLRGSGYNVCPFSNRTDDVNIKPIYVFSLTTRVDYDDLAKLPYGSIVFLNMLTDTTREYAKLSNLICIEYFKNEPFLIRNAILTAQGVLALILQNTAKTLKELSVMLIGYGRVGKACSLLFHDNNINHAIVNRESKHLYEGLLLTESVFDINQFPYYIDEYEIIINTIPSLILTQSVIKNIRQDALIIDLASQPGGIDFNATKKHNIKSIHALGLPGRFAPKTAANYIKKLIIDNKEFKIIK